MTQHLNCAGNNYFDYYQSENWTELTNFSSYHFNKGIGMNDKFIYEIQVWAMNYCSDEMMTTVSQLSYINLRFRTMYKNHKYWTSIVPSATPLIAFLMNCK